MELGYLPLGEPGVFRSLLLPETADALAAGEPLTALVLTEGELAVGAAAGFLENGRFLITSLYVAPAYRRKGGGRQLVETLSRLCAPYAGAMELRFTATREEHDTLPPFLAAMGFVPVPDGGENIYLTTLERAAASAFFSGAGKSGGTPLSDLSKGQLSLMEKAAYAVGAPWPEGGVLAPGVDREVSVAVLDGSETRAFVLFDHSFPNALTLAAAWSADPNPVVLPSLLRSAMVRAREKYPAEMPVAVQAINPASAALVRALLPDAKPISHTYLYEIDPEKTGEGDAYV